ncbi:unnamed protein product [Adineta steineri]|uniref:Uncharacterized protein n=1 Tax=Adineta steineri TaxID=433720 RepID=A0A819IWB9_9BILA|nr:unnamed protein product [Adineta steineri]CAF3923741.1 unnamed protein product [Adineta steineri]
MTQINLSENCEDLSWVGLINKAVKENELMGSTCHIYSKKDSDNETVCTKRCLCGRHARRHSFEKDAEINLRSDKDWEKARHATGAPVTVYGEWQDRTKFIRWDYARVKQSENSTANNNSNSLTNFSSLATMILADRNNRKPDLLISCYGGAKYFKIDDKLEKQFKDGIGLAAATEGVWLLSTGLNSGVSKKIGQAVWRYALLNNKQPNHTLIGLATWGCLSERTRQVFRQQAKIDQIMNKRRRISVAKMNGPLTSKLQNLTDDDVPSWSILDENHPDTPEINHTYFLMLDDGSEGERKTSKNCEPFYADDGHRSTFVDELKALTECHTVTIIVEGGLDSISVINNDLTKQRPVVIIHNSGRLATAICNLLESTRDCHAIGRDEIEQQLIKVTMSTPTKRKISKNHIKQIEFILLPENRPYINIFRLDNNTSLTDAIFLAVFRAHIHRETENKKTQNNSQPNDWIKKMLDLAIMWNYANGINEVIENNEIIYYDPTWSVDLFEKAVLHNRPVFIDYFLRRQHDALETSSYIEFKSNREKENIRIMKSSLRLGTVLSNFDFSQMPSQPDDKDHTIPIDNDLTQYEVDEANIRAAFGRKFVIEKLYEKTNREIEKLYHAYTLTELDDLYYRLVGPYAESFFHVRSTRDRIEIDLRTKLRRLFKCCQFGKRNGSVAPLDSSKRPRLSQIHPKQKSPTQAVVAIHGIDSLQELIERYSAIKTFGTEEMLRNIFLWAVLQGHVEMAFILLLHLKCRIVAALLAAGITERLISTTDGYLDRMHEFHKQSNDYAKFATTCIDECYKYSEQRACELLLREIPSFGNITCMQVAISFRIRSFINSRCFDQVLNRQWYGALDQTKDKGIMFQFQFITSLLSLGFVAPFFLGYRNDRSEEREKSKEKSDYSVENKRLSFKRSWEGIEDYDGTKMNYGEKLRQFHRVPLVRMCYHFLIYIWMLLAFSNMMLFEMRSENAPVHWTEIYVIITITTMLIDDIQKLAVEYHTQMLERWHQKDLWMVGVYALPYILFYIGIGLQFESRVRPDLFTAARIVLALDLELWFLFSLRFVSAIKLLGPKLFMIRNMLKNLTGFLYIIFVCIAAYGIVSRALTMYSSIEMTAKNLSIAILYRPYWFLYSIVDDELDDLNNIINSESSTAAQIAEATTNHVLLAFHMLFINILILNLLIAAFNFTIDDVQEQSEYFWRYQRYELIREYFEKPFFAYPPLSLLAYLFQLVKYCLGRNDVLRIFKRYATKKTDADWTNFEQEATYNYARDFVDRMYADSSTLVIPTFSETDDLKAEVEALKRKSNQMSDIIDSINAQAKGTIRSMNWMMTAMNRVKMSSEPPPIVSTTTLTEKSYSKDKVSNNDEQ